jgi:hypothetical protein
MSSLFKLKSTTLRLGRGRAGWPLASGVGRVSQQTLGLLTKYWILKKHPQTHGHTTTRPRFSLTRERPGPIHIPV